MSETDARRCFVSLRYAYITSFHALTLIDLTMMKRTIIMLALALCSLTGWAQCKFVNNSFQSGEKLTYDLYFNWKFIWIKCGSATYSTKKTEYKGQEAMRTDLLFKTNKKFDGIFTLRDTLQSYITPELVPLYYNKASLEGKRHRFEEVWYSYPKNNCQVKLRYLNPDNKEFTATKTMDDCVYDMMSLFSVARTYDASTFKVGHRLHFPMTSCDEVKEQVLIYRGKEEFKANDGNTYRCLVFTLLDDEVKNKERELCRFYFSDDKNHIPLRIDFNLKFGTAKGFFSKAEGLKYPLSSKVK